MATLSLETPRVSNLKIDVKSHGIRVLVSIKYHLIEHRPHWWPLHIYHQDTPPEHTLVKTRVLYYTTPTIRTYFVI